MEKLKDCTRGLVSADGAIGNFCGSRFMNLVEQSRLPGSKEKFPINTQRLSGPPGTICLPRIRHYICSPWGLLENRLKEPTLNTSDELCERVLLKEVRSLAQFFENIRPHSSMVSREQEIGIQEALDHVAHKNIPRAIRVLHQVVENAPLNLKGHLLLGTIYMNLRSYPRAVKVFSKGREICRRTIKYLLMHADLLAQDGNTEDDRDLVVLLHRIADMRFFEGLFLHKLAEDLIRIGAYSQAMRLMAYGDTDGLQRHGH